MRRRRDILKVLDDGKSEDCLMMQSIFYLAVEEYKAGAITKEGMDWLVCV